MMFLPTDTVVTADFNGTATVIEPIATDHHGTPQPGLVEIVWDDGTFDIYPARELYLY